MIQIESVSPASVEQANAISERLRENPDLKFKMYKGYAVFIDGVILSPLGKEVKSYCIKVKGRQYPYSVVDGKKVYIKSLCRKLFREAGCAYHQLQDKIEANPQMERITFFEHTIFHDGTVYGKTGRQLKPSAPKDRHGIGSIRFFIESKYYRIGLARLVAICFVPNENSHPYIVFKDGNRHNCAADNLEWTSTFVTRRAIVPLSALALSERVKGINMDEVAEPEWRVIYEFQSGHKAAIISYLYEQYEKLLRKINYDLYPYGSLDLAHDLFHTTVEEIERIASADRVDMATYSTKPITRLFYGISKYKAYNLFKNNKRQCRLTMNMHTEADEFDNLMTEIFDVEFSPNYVTEQECVDLSSLLTSF